MKHPHAGDEFLVTVRNEAEKREIFEKIKNLNNLIFLVDHGRERKETRCL